MFRLSAPVVPEPSMFLSWTQEVVAKLLGCGMVVTQRALPSHWQQSGNSNLQIVSAII